MAERPRAPWKRARCCAVGNRAALSRTQGRPVPPPRGSSCGRGSAWPWAARRGSVPSAEAERRAWQFTLTVLLVAAAALGMCLWGS